MIEVFLRYGSPPDLQDKTQKSDPFPRYEKAPQVKNPGSFQEACESHDQHA